MAMLSDYGEKRKRRTVLMSATVSILDLLIASRCSMISIDLDIKGKGKDQ